MNKAPLDRGQWQPPGGEAFGITLPLVSVIVTHRDYTSFIRQALVSLIGQTHERWECVVVDDCSDPAHRRVLEQILAELNSDKIRVLWLDENVGQVHAFFAGLAMTSGDFVCLLDPDDRYAPTFIEEALRGHLNNVVFCPMLSTDQCLVGPTGVITGVLSKHNIQSVARNEGASVSVDSLPGRLLYFPPDMRGWHWSSTSALMFRRSVLALLHPRKQLAYKGSADSYLANGSHLLGGTLFSHDRSSIEWFIATTPGWERAFSRCTRGTRRRGACPARLSASST